MRDGQSIERALVARCLEGDGAAWQALVVRYQSLIYSVARAHFRDAGAEDVFQEVCMELFRRLDTINDLQSLPAWLITVTRRKCSQAIGRLADHEDVDSHDLATVDHRLGAIEQRFWIERAMDLLSDREQQLITALYFDPDQPSYSEISTRLDIPVASIGPTRARCLEKLRRHWEAVK